MLVVVTEELEDTRADRKDVIVAERVASERRIVRPEDGAEVAIRQA
jgi:hypothetical protein